jgi:hypothetical protein
MKVSNLVKFMVEQAPVFDEQIMASIRPDSSWTLEVNQPWEFDRWRSATESVRRLSEGSHYKPTVFKHFKDYGFGVVPMGTPINVTKERLKGVWPETKTKWESIKTP